jgi:hypothetical protein
MPAPWKQIITADETRRAIYIDYEGNKDRPPTLLGVLISESTNEEEWRLQQTVFEPEFWPCVGKKGAKTTAKGDHVNTLRQVIELAHNNERCIVAWSEHELNIVQELEGLSNKEKKTFEASYRNARHTAKRWLRSCHPESHIKPIALATCLEIAGIRVPDKFGPGRVGYNLRTIRKQLKERGGTYGDLTPGARVKWREVTGHNKHDLEDMRKLLMKMAVDLE